MKELTNLELLMEYMEQNQYFIGNDLLAKYNELLQKEKKEQLRIGGVSVSLPSVENAGIIAVEISEINNELTAQEQAFFIAGFQECVKYLEMQSNER